MSHLAENPITIPEKQDVEDAHLSKLRDTIYIMIDTNTDAIYHGGILIIFAK